MFEIKKNKIYLCILASLLIFELIFRVYTKEKIFSWGYFFHFIFSIILSSIIYGLLCFLKNEKLKKNILSVLIIVIALFYIAQMVYNKIFRTFFTVYLMTHGMKAFSFWKDMLIYMYKILPWICGILLVAVTFVILIRKFEFDKIEIKKVVILNLCSIAVLVALSFFGKDFYGNAKYAFSHYNPIEAYFEGTGLTFSMLNDLVKNFVKEEKDNADNKKLFGEKETAKSNLKTGIFKGKNLILICAESFSPYVIDKEYTPTLYKMSTEGFHFTNFYSPLWAGSTADGEFSFLSSLIPKYTGMTIVDTINNEMPNTIAKRLELLNYKNLAFHNNDGYYYKRNETYPNLGYKFKALNLGLDITKQWPESDLEMIEKSTVDYLQSSNNDPFNVFYITVSGHLSYNFITDAMAIKNKKVYENTKYSDGAKAYLSANYELELAMKKLLEKLKEANELDNTVICIVPDHFPYGLSDKEYSEISNLKMDNNIDRCKSICILYNTAIKSESVEKYCYSIDILPTLLNMFGIEYDKNIYAGRDIFSNDEPLVIFKDKSWIDNLGIYNVIENSFKKHTDKEYINYEKLDRTLQEYINSKNTYVENKVLISKNIVDNNLYNRR